MTIQDIWMLGVAVIGGAAALLVVTARNVVHAALYLVVTLLTVAGAFLALGAEFLAWTQVLVYVGAVMVLLLFGLMLTRAPIGPMAQHNDIGRLLPVAVSGGLFVFLTAMILTSFGDLRIELTYVGAAELGQHLYIFWAFPFMVLGFFLTVSLIGAIILARKEEGEGPDPQVDADLRTARPTPVPSDATTNPGRPAGEPAREVSA